MRGIITEIVSQHADEAAFLWRLRQAIVQAPHYTLAELADWDDRIEAHLDGLRIAGEAGWLICKDELSWEEAEGIFVAAVLALSTDSEERIADVLDASWASPEQSQGFVSALGWMPYPRIEHLVRRLLEAEPVVLRYLGVAGAAVHRQDPGVHLSHALSASDARLQMRALKAVGELGRRDLLPWTTAQGHGEDEASRFYAARSAALLGAPQAALALRELAESDGAYADSACSLTMRCLPLREARAWHQWLAARPEHHRKAIIGAGAAGDPDVLPWLIEKMGVPELARIAGEAFTSITGADLIDLNLDTQPPEGFEAGPTEDPEDEEVEMDADEGLPWPDPALVAAWWHVHASALQPGSRHFLGRPLGESVLEEALQAGKQRQRAAAALELALMQPGHPLFEVRAPGFRQQQELSSGL